MQDSLENRGLKFRYFGVGEYGAQFSRPHYHALIFGYDFEDKVYLRGPDNARLYTSEALSELWTEGYATVGSLSQETAQYVSQYCVKKLTGKMAKDWYGERSPEFAIMSRRPGIGRGWIDQFATSVFPRDFVVTRNGARVAVPRFYLEAQKEALRKQVKAARLLRMKDDPDARGSRAVAKAACAEARINRAQRSYEQDESTRL